MSDPKAGDRLADPRGRVIGRVDAVFADYLLVRTRGILPVDLYVPRDEVTADGAGGLQIARAADEAYQAWHRPLRRAPHD
jgi:hypothetical protein